MVESFIRLAPVNRSNMPMNMKEPAWQLAYRQYTIYPLTSSTGQDVMTWGVLKRALDTLLDFMFSNEAGTGLVTVWDGTRHVGSIVIGGEPAEPDYSDYFDDPNVAGPSTFPGSLNFASSSNAAGSSSPTELG